MKEEPAPQAARIFSELLDSVQERLHFQAKLTRFQGCSNEHLRNLLRAVHYEKERQASRVRREDDLISEIAISKSLDKQLKLHMTNFSFEAMEMLQPQLSFRLERHYVNLGKLFSLYFQSLECRDHYERIMAALGSTCSAFKLEYYIGLLRLFLENLRATFGKIMKESTAGIIAQLKREEPDSATEMREGSNPLTLFGPSSQQQAYTGRSHSRRKRHLTQKGSMPPLKTSMQNIEQKLNEINQAVEENLSYRFGPSKFSMRFQTYFQPIAVQGSNQNLRNETQTPSRNSVEKRLKRQISIRDSGGPSARYIGDQPKSVISTEPEPVRQQQTDILLLPEAPYTVPNVDRHRSLRRNNVSEENRKYTSNQVSPSKKLPPLPQLEQSSVAEIPNPQVRKYSKIPSNTRKYYQFLELYSSNIVGAAGDALPDLDVDYHRQRKKKIPDRDAWLQEHLNSVLIARLAENHQTLECISRFSTEYYNSQPKDARTSPQKRPSICRTLGGQYTPSTKKDWRI